MLKALLLSLMNLALAAMATAQNLVPNPSFEDTTYCIGWPPPQLEAQHWYTANTATPDIWNCNLVSPCGYHVMDPDDSGIQLQGYKYAYDGDRFAGGFHWYGVGSSNTREYFTTKLSQPLLQGVQYVVSVYCAKPTGVNGAIDHIGVHFGADSIHAPYPTTLPLVPQVQLRDPSNEYLVDTSWVQLVDTFLASGNERWMTIGTFDDADAVNGIWLGWGSFPPTVYYYVDMLSVETLIHAGMNESDRFMQHLLMRGDVLIWSGSDRLLQFVVVDGSGRVVWRAESIAQDGRYPVPRSLSSGVYLAIATTAGGRTALRFVK